MLSNWGLVQTYACRFDSFLRLETRLVAVGRIGLESRCSPIPVQAVGHQRSTCQPDTHNTVEHGQGSNESCGGLVSCVHVTSDYLYDVQD